MLDTYLVALQQSAFSTWVQETAYPVVITAHSIGLATLVGLLVIIDLRVIGFGKGMPLPALRKLMIVVWSGFVLNFISGMMLFSIDAKKDFHSTLFRIKILSIVVGLVFGWLIDKSVLTQELKFSSPDARAPGRARVFAAASLLCWVTAIISGRLLAYFTYGDVGIE
jgi:hypothetical protein